VNDSAGTTDNNNKHLGAKECAVTEEEQQNDGGKPTENTGVDEVMTVITVQPTRGHIMYQVISLASESDAAAQPIVWQKQCIQHDI
jgi:hypothetical protein